MATNEADAFKNCGCSLPSIEDAHIDFLSLRQHIPGHACGDWRRRCFSPIGVCLALTILVVTLVLGLKGAGQTEPVTHTGDATVGHIGSVNSEQNRAIGGKSQQEGKEGGFVGFSLRSPAFNDSDPIPEKYTGSHGISPPLIWSNMPLGTKSFALLFEELSSPTSHWVVYDIPPLLSGLDEDVPPALDGSAEVFLQGVNSKPNVHTNCKGATIRGMGYLAPNPSSVIGKPLYQFDLFAIAGTIDLNPHNATSHAVKLAMKGMILGKAVLRGTFENQ